MSAASASRITPIPRSLNPVEPIVTHPWKPIPGWWAAYRNPEGLVGFGSTKEGAINDLLELEAARL